MTASALPAANAAPVTPLPALSTLAGQAGNVPLTRVSLAYLEHRFKLYLRFGEPARTLRLDDWRRCAVFLPGAMLCRIRWQANDYGTIRWQLMVMQACTSLDTAQRIPGVQPGARLLLHAEGENQVRAVLSRIDAIEALGIAPATVSPAYWRTLANRLAARLPLPEYTAERHAAWLAGKVTGKARTQVLAQVASGEAQVVVGTHALMQETVVFHDLGLAIVDEQHRFGVHQRLALRDKGAGVDRVPHQLVMTATPIPRTLAMAAYADLDVSAIDELPPGRTPVQTVALSAERRPELVERIRAACAEGRQAYWVCTLIDDSDEVVAQAAQTTYEALSASLPELRVALVHGRMKAADKQATMRRFKEGEADLLVATTVIEVGVNVPEATITRSNKEVMCSVSKCHGK